MNWRLAKKQESDRIPEWRLMRHGISKSLRSWGVAKGVRFPGYKERKLNVSRHRRVTRIWLEGCKKTWSQVEIWTGWSEVTFNNFWPDALAWGKLDGFETLFWLEVESGHRSRQGIVQIIRRRINLAITYARRFPVRLAVVLMAPLWVLDVLADEFVGVPYDLAVVLGKWVREDQITSPEWGKVKR
jgi:hypothetical protein